MANRLKGTAAILKEESKAMDESRLGSKGKPEEDNDKGGKA